MTRDKILTRRDFVRETARGSAGLALGLPVAADVLSRPARRSIRVVLVRHKEVLDEDRNINGDILAQMLDDAVMTLFEKDNPEDCWSAILRPDDVLGIKTNVYRPLRTPTVLEQALKQRAMAVGIPEADMSIRDRNLRRDPIFMRATALLNARPVRAHDWSGMGGCLKNYITFSNPPDWHGDSCADLGGLWKLPVCEGKTRLNILVALTPFFHSIGPHQYDPEAVWSYKGMLVSTDPVAVDALGAKLLEEMRIAFYERPPRGGTSTKHIGLADTRHGIGIANLEEIELVKIGWTEETLI
jgi:hypothetical protein